MNKVLVAVEEQSFVAPTKLSVREFLAKEWLPAVEATIRPTTYRSYVQHVFVGVWQAPSVMAAKASISSAA